MRQEPIVYVNGNPVCARPPNKVGEYAELGDVTRASVKADEEEFLRILVCNSAAPLEPDFDTLCNALLGTNVNAPVIVNCQVGLSRSTTGCVAACLFREFQLSASYEGLVETVPGVNLEVLRMDNYQMDKAKGTGIKQLRENIAESKLSYEI